MSTPEHHHVIDPLSETLGELKADVRALREVLGAKATIEQVVRLDERTKGLLAMVGGLYGLVTLGFTILGWLVTRPH